MFFKNVACTHTHMQSKYHADGRHPFLGAIMPDEEMSVEGRLLPFVLVVIVAVVSSGGPQKPLHVFASHLG